MTELNDKLGLDAEQKGTIKEMDPMHAFAFYNGVARGVLMVMNTMMLKHAGCTLEQYRQRMVKQRIPGIVSVQDELDLIGSLVVETQKMAHQVGVMAAKDAEKKQKEKANENQ